MMPAQRNEPANERANQRANEGTKARTTSRATPWALVLAGLGCLVGLYLWLAPSDPPTKAAPVQADAALVARGHYLARAGNCAHCHTARGGEAYAGGRAVETPFGAVVSSNITPDKLYGIGNWTSDDFWQALHHGQSADGRLLYPAFPYTSYTHVSRTDAEALFAYLQSLPAVPRANDEHRLRWPYSTQAALWVWRTLFFTPDATASTRPSTDANALERGAYLVQGLGHCAECHSPRNALGAMAADSSGERPGGGFLAQGRWYAPALTRAREAGVGSWSEADIMALLQTGTSPQGRAQGPMAEVVLHSTQYLQDADARAMAAYLRSIDTSGASTVASATPAASAASTSASAQASAQAHAEGQKLYDQHCADCHGAQGQGRYPAYPALAGNRAVTLPVANNAIHAVLHGGFAAATAGNPRPYGMPPYMLTLDDRQAAQVLSYVRSAWGNQASPVTAFDINSLRR